MQITVHAADDVRAAELQLHVRPGPGARCVLFGWEVVPVLVDAGPPAMVEEVFAAALVACGMVAFLTTEGPSVATSAWRVVDGDQWMRVPLTAGDRLRGMGPMWMRATSSAERARELFTGVDWGGQQQVGLVLRGGALPVLSREMIADVIRARDASIEELALPAEVLALVLPGVDGDYVEFVAREAAVRDAMRAAVKAGCEARGCVRFEG